jgi:ABC-2 type transport system ATP-binding protein
MGRKTTTLECLEGIRKPDAGALRLLGVDPSREPRKLHNLIGVQLQTSGLPANMTVEEALKFFSAYHAVVPQFELLGRLGLDEKRRSQYSQLSTGQQRRLSLALAIAHNPPVIISTNQLPGWMLPAGGAVRLMEEPRERHHDHPGNARWRSGR